MGGPSRRALVSAVRRLPADEHTALLAALRREREGPGTARPTGDRTVGDTADSDPAETARALLYAVDRGTADRLCRDHLDRPLAELYPPERADRERRDGRSGRTTGRTPGDRVRVLAGRVRGALAEGAPSLAVTAVALALVLGAGVATLPAMNGLSAAPAPTPEAVATPVSIETPGPESDGAVAPVGGGQRVSTQIAAVASATPRDGPLRGFPSGLDRDGVTSAGELAAGHALAVAERSYVWRLTYREVSESGTRAVRWETVRVERPGRYRTTVTGWGSLAARTTPVSSVEAFGDGERRFVRRVDGNATSYRSGPVLRQDRPGRYVLRASRLVRWQVAGEPTRIASRTGVGDRTYYRVFVGDGYDSATPTARLTVDDEGMIHAFHTRFPVGGSNVTAVVSFEYAEVGTTTVGPPAWYDEATEATGTPAPTDSGPDATPAASADGSREARP